VLVAKSEEIEDLKRFTKSEIKDFYCTQSERAHNEELRTRLAWETTLVATGAALSITYALGFEWLVDIGLVVVGAATT